MSTDTLVKNHIIVKDSEGLFEWVYTVNPDEWEGLKEKGRIDEHGRLLLTLPYIASIKKISADDIIQHINDRIYDMDIPDIKIDIKHTENIAFDSLQDKTNMELENLLSLAGSYRSYIESQLSIVESEKHVLDAFYEDGLNKTLYLLEDRYKNRDGGRKPNKESLKGEALSLNPRLGEVRQKLIEIEALYIRLSRVREVWATISRIIGLRVSGAEKV